MILPKSPPSVDDAIYECLDMDNPKSFFLLAGAGSGKTRSLVTVLKRFRDENVNKLKLRGQKVAIITYTNAACNEIKDRLNYDPAFVVSTIHSFSWELINPFQHDIREWVRNDLETEIENLKIKQSKGRAGTKAAIDRERKLKTKTKKLEEIDEIRKFIYNPNGVNSGKASLNHADVIKIASDFLLSQDLMQKILINKFPILLIDECQDTKKELIDSLLKIQFTHNKQFSLGLFGDLMQRIYVDGKKDLMEIIPEDWIKIEKTINYRSPVRVIKLINKIRSYVDDHIQEPYKSNEKGVVRLFILEANNNLDKNKLESRITEKMSQITNDNSWTDSKEGVKTLTLEHHMAASRSGFGEILNPLYKVNSNSTGLLDGTLSGIPFFTTQVLPLVKAKISNDEFLVAQLVRKHSLLLKGKYLKENKNPVKAIQKANKAVNSIASLFNDGSDPTLLSILKNVEETGLFPIPEVLDPIAVRSTEIKDDDDSEENNKNTDYDENIDAWDKALNATFSQLEAYADYISDKSKFGTHQGVKGLEFPRVMVILDADEERGFLFSYEKLFGAKDPTATDITNEKEGKETSIDRTRRLFYVTCSRAENSLAIVAYTQEPEKVKKYVTEQKWFEEDEVILDFK